MSLPSPSEHAALRSQQLVRLIEEMINLHGGWISFEQYMQLALYSPSLGYYSGESKKFGEDGDFVTAPEISPLFGYCVGRQIEGVLKTKSESSVMELGAGRGRLALDILSYLDEHNALPKRYAILEVSASLREIQQEFLKSALPDHVFSCLVWLDSLPDTWTGVILGNEVLDAVPFRWVEYTEGSWFELGVCLNDTMGEGEFLIASRPMPVPETIASELVSAWPSRYVTEYSPQALALTKTLTNILQQGLILWIDYGFGAREYYHPQRNQGTLMCHYQHRAHDNPLLWPGLQDMTAHVDFTAIAEASVAAGAELAGFTSQAQFLINCGITDLLMPITLEQDAEYIKQVAHAQKLLSPAEMGELFKVLALTKGNIDALCGFQSGDRSHVL